MVAVQVDWPNQLNFWLAHVSLLAGHYLPILIAKFLKPKMLPHIHKNVLFKKGIKILIAKSIT